MAREGVARASDRRGHATRDRCHEGGLVEAWAPPPARASLTADDMRVWRALTGSAGGRYGPGTVQAHHFFFMDPA